MIFSKLTCLASILARVVSAHEISFDTDDLDIFNSLSQDAIQHLISGWDTFDLQFGGILFHYTPDEGNLTEAETRSPHYLESRVPPPMCKEPSCYTGTHYAWFSRAQQEFMAGKLCPLVAHVVGDGGAGVITAYATKATCGDSTKCTLIAGAAFGFASGYGAVGAALAKPCVNTFTFIESHCGDLGGTRTCYDSGKAVTYKLEAAATTPTSSCSTPSKCTKIVCDSGNANCQKYSKRQLLESKE